MTTDFDDEFDDCGCICHDEDARREYRVVKGSSIEGLSIREVVYDTDDKIHCWSPPLVPPSGSREEISNDLQLAINDMMSMYQALDKPVLDEVDLEMDNE